MKYRLFFTLLLIHSVCYSQDIPEQNFFMTHVVRSIGVSTVNITDPYLSPLTYSGLNINYNVEDRKSLISENSFFSNYNAFHLNGGIAFNPAFSSSEIFAATNFRYGIHYHLYPIKNLMLLAGGSWDVDAAIKYLPRNSNNPVNFDLATNLNLSGRAFYNFKALKKEFQLQLSFESPLIGCMFVPSQGASYYEMFMLNNMTDAFHFSSIYNKRGIQSKLLLNVPFLYSDWHIGIGYNSIKYLANEMVFKQDELNFVIGTSFDMIRFAGTKGKAPSNFKSAYL